MTDKVDSLNSNCPGSRGKDWPLAWSRRELEGSFLAVSSLLARVVDTNDPVALVQLVLDEFRDRLNADAERILLDLARSILGDALFFPERTDDPLAYVNGFAVRDRAMIKSFRERYQQFDFFCDFHGDGMLHLSSKLRVNKGPVTLKKVDLTTRALRSPVLVCIYAGREFRLGSAWGPLNGRLHQSGPLPAQDDLWDRFKSHFAYAKKKFGLRFPKRAFSHKKDRELGDWIVMPNLSGLEVAVVCGPNPLRERVLVMGSAALPALSRRRV